MTDALRGHPQGAQELESTDSPNLWDIPGGNANENHNLN